jgi:hypothetical protein
MKERYEELEQFVDNQKVQLGLDESEAKALFDSSMEEIEAEEEFGGDISAVKPGSPMAADASGKRIKKMKKPQRIHDPYLQESRSVHARPTRVSKMRSVFYEMALPNEYIVQIGKVDDKPVLGGKFFKLGKRFLKFPAAVQTVYFTSDNANRNYQGIKIDGYACWRIDAEKPEIAARSLDFSDQANPMGNTNRILRTICTEAIRHIIANQTIDEALTKKDDIGLNLKSQLERIEREWGVKFDQVGIERVTILSARVFEDLQQKARDDLRLTAAESKMETDQSIQKKASEHTEEMEALRCRTEKEARIMKATNESAIHKVELDEKSKREEEERKSEEQGRTAQNEAEERADVQKAERDKRQVARDAQVEALKLEEKRKLEMTKSAAETEIRIHTAENEAKMISALTQGELKEAEAVHEKETRVQELTFGREMKTAEDKKRINEIIMTAELERDASRFEQSLKQQRELALAEDEIETAKLKRLKIEEEVKNLLSTNRVLAEFVEKLPDIAAAVDVDRYTVISGSGDSPLTHTLAQILSLMDQHGLRKLLHPKKKEKETEPR